MTSLTQKGGMPGYYAESEALGQLCFVSKKFGAAQAPLRACYMSTARYSHLAYGTSWNLSPLIAAGRILCMAGDVR